MNLENFNFNINNLSNLKPITNSTYTTDKYNSFLSDAKTKLFDSKTYPYNSEINNNNINNIINNILLKRACCMRTNDNVKVIVRVRPPLDR